MTKQKDNNTPTQNNSQLEAAIEQQEEANKSLQKLSFILFFLAVVIELGLVGSGLAASYETGDRQISLVTVFFGLIALGEMTAIFSTEALARSIKYKKKFRVKILAFFAVLVAVSFTLFNLGHISMIVEKKESGAFEEFQNSKIKLHTDIKTETDELNQNMIALEAIKSNSNSIDFLDLYTTEQTDLEKERQVLLEAIETIKENNYSAELNTQNFLLNTNRAKRKELQEELDRIDESYKYELNQIREDRRIELMSAGIFSKQDTKNYFADLRVDLDKKYNKLKAPYLNEIKHLNDQNINIKKLISSYANLSPKSKIEIEKAEAKLAALEIKEKQASNARSIFFDNRQESIVDIENTISEKTLLIAKHQKDLNKIINDENTWKKDSWLLQMASNYYKKSISSITLQEFKSFAFYFILASCLGLAILPKGLVILSVGMEKNTITDEVKTRKTNSILLFFNYFLNAKRREEVLNQKFKNRSEKEHKKTQEVADKKANAAEKMINQVIQEKNQAIQEKDKVTQEKNLIENQYVFLRSEIKKHPENFKKILEDLFIKHFEDKQARPKVIYKIFPDYSEDVWKKSSSDEKGSSSSLQPTGFSKGPKFRNVITKRFIKN